MARSSKVHIHNGSTDAVISRLRLQRHPLKTFVMSLRLYRALTEHPERLDLLFFILLCYHSDPNNIYWDRRALLTFLLRSLAFNGAFTVFLVHCNADLKNLNSGCGLKANGIKYFQT